MNQKCAIFDLDGTLVDSLPDITLAANAMLACFELEPVTEQQIRGYIGNGVTRLVEQLISGTGVQLKDALPIMRECYRRALNVAGKPYPGVYAGLKDLKAAGWKIALLSNKPDDFCKFTLFDDGLGPFFDLISGDVEGAPRKPDPAGIFEIMRILEITDKDQVWMVGDGPADIEVAANAGVHSAWMTYGYGSLRPEQTYDLKCDNFTDFIRQMLAL